MLEEFYENILNSLSKKVAEEKEMCCNNTLTTIEQYKFRMGRLEAYLRCEEMVKEVFKKLMVGLV